ncbi:helix-turn-helix domain-containing protein [Streptomyces sp. NPDC102406]|uniref:helix-turn-helix domain-containing protein n=1 Tax=Streptomyces sp. NPDC102406 TaxID=3366171 RepID=UPI0038112D41
MDTQNPSVPSRARSGVATNNPPDEYGIAHENARHHTRFTVVGNHLAQHRELSGLAIGLAVHIQSLPAGARADVRTLAARFPEGTTRIAAALRELEHHGYLRRERRRTPDGRVRTRTVSCNQPGAAPVRTEHAPKPPRPRKPRPLTVPHPESTPGPGLLRAAVDLLAGLHRTDARLALSTRDTERLTPGVAAWLERDLSPAAVRHALTRDLPEDRPIHSPAALLAHRLVVRLPPLSAAFKRSREPEAVRHPLHNCDGCDRAYRGPEPGRCPNCSRDEQGREGTRQDPGAAAPLTRPTDPTDPTGPALPPT